jgi:energy-coupling factor transporter ATP-binding protein EcfA2
MPRIFVYFRDVAFLDQVPSDQLRTYVDTGDAESKLNNLKERIICSGVPVKWFSSPAEMVSLLEADLAASISADFGDRFSNQTALQKELSAQQAIIDTCCDIYEGGAGYIEAFRAYLNADVTNQSILVVSGARGSGKSAALANFAQSLKTSAQKKLLPVAMSASGKVDWNNVVVLSRFVGASLQSGRLSSLIASLLDELKFHFGDAVIADEDSDRQPTGDELREKLEIASRKAPLVVILDGLDLLRADDRSKLMSFLPLSFGSRCRVYVSCPPSMLSQFSSLAIKRVDVRLLDDVECTRLVDAYLSRFGKMLDQQQKRQVLACSQSRSPLFLRTFLEEIRTFGSYEKLGDRLTHYLSSADLGVLIDKVFGRIETDMASLGNDTQTLVHAMLGALACARRGLTENELRTICLRALHQLDDCKPVLASLPFPALVFSSLQIQCSPFLVSHLGIMSFAHSTVADAARSRYLNDESALFIPLFSQYSLIS